MSNLESNSPIWFESLLIKIYDICLEFFWSYGFGYGLRPKAKVFHGRTFGYGQRWKLSLRSNTGHCRAPTWFSKNWLYISLSMPNLQFESWIVFTNYRERESKFPSELNGHSQDQSKSNMFQHVPTCYAWQAQYYSLSRHLPGPTLAHELQ